MTKLMSNITLTLLAMVLTGKAWAQEERSARPGEVIRKIEVHGHAEREITPNEIYFTITLKEYQASDHQKVPIDQLEKDLYEAIRKMDISEEDFQVMDVASYNYDWYRRGKKQEREDFQAAKQYRITFEDLNEINQLFEYVDPKGIQSTNISGYSHSDLEQMTRELKIEALRDARSKAEALLGGIDESLGEVIEVQEINNDYQPPVLYARSMEMAQSDEAQPEINFKKITLKAQVRTVFRIQN